MGRVKALYMDIENWLEQTTGSATAEEIGKEASNYSFEVTHISSQIKELESSWESLDNGDFSNTIKQRSISKQLELLHLKLESLKNKYLL